MVQGAALQNIIAVFARVAAVSVYPVTMHHASSAPRIKRTTHWYQLSQSHVRFLTELSGTAQQGLLVCLLTA